MHPETGGPRLPDRGAGRSTRTARSRFGWPWIVAMVAVGMVALGALGAAASRSPGAALGKAVPGVADPASASALAPTSAPSTVLTHSANREFRPPDDVEIGSCAAGPLGFAQGQLVVTNHSPKTSTYAITFAIESGGARVGEVVQPVRDLAAGGVARIDVHTLTKAPAAFTCRVVRVDRWAA